MRAAGRFATILTLEAVCLVAGDNDWLIVPGKRLGPITATSTRADLIRMFGAKNVVEADVTVGEDEPEPGTIVFADEPDKKLAIVWTDDGHVNSVAICQDEKANCRWHTADGISLGTSLKMLERLNGRSFQFYGFGWDYGGAVVSWEDGRLERLQSGMCGALDLTLDVNGSMPPERRKIYDQLQGEVEFSSSDSAAQTLAPAVVSMTLAFGQGPDCDKR